MTKSTRSIFTCIINDYSVPMTSYDNVIWVQDELRLTLVGEVGSCDVYRFNANDDLLINDYITRGVIIPCALSYNTLTGDLTMTLINTNDRNQDVCDAVEAIITSCIDSGTFEERAATYFNENWNIDNAFSMLVSFIDGGALSEDAGHAILNCIEEMTGVTLG